MNGDEDVVWCCPVHGIDGCPLDCEAANTHLDDVDRTMAHEEEAIAGIGAQIRVAEETRNHIEFNKLGDHIEALFGGLSKLSVGR